jgi:hypothetical protein
MTDSEKLNYWLGGANIEPIEAMIGLGVKINVTGKLK